MDAAYGAPAPATIIEEIPDSALPSNGIAETLAEGTFNLLASFVRYAVAPAEHHYQPRTVVAPAPVVQPAPQKRVHRARPQTASYDRPKPAQHRPSVKKSASPKGSKKKK